MMRGVERFWCGKGSLNGNCGVEFFVMAGADIFGADEEGAIEVDELFSCFFSCDLDGYEGFFVVFGDGDVSMAKGFFGQVETIGSL